MRFLFLLKQMAKKVAVKQRKSDQLQGWWLVS